MNDAPSQEGERIAKVMARAGLCSRREAERWIAAGRVTLNGETITGPAVTVTPDDRITVDGQALPEREPTRIWRYHKPAGLVTTNRDPQGRPTVFDELPPDLPRVVTVGRLDVGSEGLLLLTNDGATARRLELPATGWRRRYRVRVHGGVDTKALKALENGVTVEGIRYAPITATLERDQAGSNAWITVTLTEGKNREVRRVMQHLGLHVNRLIRVGFGPFQLGTLARGAVEEISPRLVAEQLGSGPATPGRQGWAKAKPRRRSGKKHTRASGAGRKNADHRRP